MDMMKMGFIDPNKGLELMDMGGIDKLYEELRIDERAAQRENLRMSRLDIETIMQHEQSVTNQNAMAAQQANMQAMQMPPQMPMDPGMGGMPPQEEMLPGMDTSMGMPPQDPMGQTPDMPMEPGAMGNDPNTGTPLQAPMNIVSVNTWDNHQLHIDVHNRYRKTQGFEMLADEVKAQFEYHVAMHAMALNMASQQAMMMPPPPPGGDMGGATNGSDTPVGSNQFGPPGTEQGAPPPPMMGQ
jgi:hypothetical protein